MCVCVWWGGSLTAHPVYSKMNEKWEHFAIAEEHVAKNSTSLSSNIHSLCSLSGSHNTKEGICSKARLGRIGQESAIE